MRSYYEVVSDLVGILHLQAGNMLGFSNVGGCVLTAVTCACSTTSRWARIWSADLQPAGFGPRDITSGTSNDALGGTMYWGASLEFQYPFYFLPKDAGFRGAVFVDAGSVWGYKGETAVPATGEINGTHHDQSPAFRSSAATAACNTPTRDAARMSLGASVIWDSPFGPLRFDFAYPLLKQWYDRTQFFAVRRRNAVLIAACDCRRWPGACRTSPRRPRTDDRRDRRAHRGQAARRRSARSAHRNIAPLDTRDASDISFLDNAKYPDAWRPHVPAPAWWRPISRRRRREPRRAGAPKPYRAFVAVARALFPAALRPSSLFGASGRAPAAHVHPSARIEAGVTIDPLAVIGPDAEIGSGTVIAAGAVIGPGVCIGRNCAIGAGAIVMLR